MRCLMDEFNIDEVPPEYKTVWIFSETSQVPIKYLGRCIPEIPNFCLKRFTKKNDLVLDAFMGSGTAVGECLRLNRRVIGIDPSKKSIEKTKIRLDRYFPKITLNNWIELKGVKRKFPILFKADSREIPIKDETIDFVFAHVPYWSVITYTTPEEKNLYDISRLWSLSEFNKELLKIFKELFRVLKNEKYCVVLVGDVRQSSRKVPLGYTCLTLLLEARFQFYDLIIKISENAISMRRPIVIKRAIEEDRSVTIHEYVLVVKKTTKKYNEIGLDFLKGEK